MIKELTMEKISLPNGWEMKMISEVCQIGDGNHSSKYPKSSEMLLEGVPFIRSNNLIDGELSWRDIKYISKEKHITLKKGHLKTGDVLFTNRGQIGKLAIVSDDFNDSNLNSQIAWFRSIGNLNNRFLFYFLSSPIMKRHYSTEQNGAALQQFTITKIKKIQIPLPPLAQQKQIVATLDKAFAAIDTAKANAEQNLENAKELFESYLQNVFENKGDDWEMKALGEICEMIKRGSQPKYTESADGEIVLNQKCIRDHKINLSVARKHDTSKKTINKERYIQLGDGLINSTGTGTLGRVAQVRELDFSAFVDTHITIVRPKKEVFYLDFFGWALIYIEKIIQKSGEGASGQTELSRKVVEKLIISYPNEMKQQKKIVQKLDSLSVECKKIEAIYAQ